LVVYKRIKYESRKSKSKLKWQLFI
jgi:hypothetical protein